MSTPIKTDPPKDCQTCGVPMARRRYGARLEDRNVFLKRRFCSLSCANTRAEVVKDTHHWRARKHRAESCGSCGTTERLHVHHLDRSPANNDPTNLETLCASCHLLLHWKEDRAKRLAAMRAAASRGALTRPRSADGKWSSAAKPPHPRPPGRTGNPA